MKKILFIFFLFPVLAFGQARNNGQKIFNVTLFNAKPDGKSVTDAGITNGGTTVTSATASFTSADVGKACTMDGSGAAGVDQRGTITALISSTQVTVSFTASSTVSNVEFFYGTEAQTGIQTAINAAYAAGGGIVYLPYGNGSGTYYLGGALVATTPAGSSFTCNCQLYIPQDSVTVNAPSLRRTSITIQGEFPPNHAPSGVLANAPLATKAVIIRSVVAGSGTLPSILAGPQVPDNFGSIGLTQLDVKNLIIQGYTNQGQSGVSINGINGAYIAKMDMDNVVVTTDVPIRNTASASSTDVAAVIVGKRGDDGLNIIRNTVTSGYTYGYAVGEHTKLIGAYTYASTYGFAFLSGDNDITGDVFVGWCKYPFYTSNTGTILQSLSTSGGINIFLNAVVEVMDTGTRWYSANGITNRVLDTTSLIHGIIKVKSAKIGGTDESETFAVYNAQNLIIQSMPTSIFYTNNSSSTHGSAALGVDSRKVWMPYNATQANMSIGSLRIQGASLNSGYIGDNMHLNGSFAYDSNGYAAWWHFSNGSIVGRLAPSGTAGNTITPVNVISINQDNSFGIGKGGTFGTSTGFSVGADANGHTYVGAGTVSTSTWLNVPASTTASSPLRITEGTSPTSPVTGDIWTRSSDHNVYYQTTSSYILPRTLTATATLDFASTNAQTSTDLTITVTGAAVGDAVTIGVDNASVNANTDFSAWVSSTNTVTVRFNNYSSGSVDPASGTFRAVVFKY